VCMCTVYSQVWYSVRLLDFSGGWDETLETGGSVFPSYSLLQSGKETLCTTRDRASIKVDWMSTMMSSLRPSDMRRSGYP
jgi:hypothetical protein